MSESPGSQRLVPHLEHLAWMLHGPSRGARLLLMLHTFGDESHDSKRANTLTLAGIIAPAEAWNRLWVEWGMAVKLAGLESFHAADCENRLGEFKTWTPQQVAGFQRILIDLMTNPTFGLAGYSCSLAMRPYKRLQSRLHLLRLPRGLSVSGPLHDPYFVLFQYLTEQVVTDEWLSGLPDDEKVGFTFDRHHLEPRAKAIAAAMRIARPAHKARLGGVGFEDKEVALPLQAADMLAYETFRFIDGPHLRGGTERWQISELRKIVRRVDYLDEAYLENLVSLNEKKLNDYVAQGIIEPLTPRVQRSRTPPKPSFMGLLRRFGVRALRRVRRWWRT